MRWGKTQTALIPWRRAQIWGAAMFKTSLRLLIVVVLGSFVVAGTAVAPAYAWGGGVGDFSWNGGVGDDF